MKKFIKIILTIVLILASNLLYFVFFGQKKAAEKLSQNKELNLYELSSIYQMHTALWMFGWPFSPAAANEVFLMQFTNKKDTIHHNQIIANSVLSPRIVNTMQSLKLGESKRVAYNGNISYGLNDPEHKAAMAINPCIVSRELHNGEEYYFIRLDNTWPTYSETHIKIYKDFEIVLYEHLFRYIQDLGLIHNFIDEYSYPIQHVQAI